jgi:membrane-bound lytic murein transglycosylase D
LHLAELPAIIPRVDIMLRKSWVGLVWIVFSFGSGCMTARTVPPSNGDANLTTNHPVKVENLTSPQPTEVASSEVKDKDKESEDELELAADSDTTEKSPTHPTLEAIPIEMNEHVQKWIRYFTEKDRARFQRFLNQGSQYREVVENLLDENGLPPQLYYLAMIESGYLPRATSIAKAAGVWQFIPATGKRYGLEVNHFTDERRDPIRATEAAAKYLKDLYNVFGSWYLAISAYNAGEFRIMGSVIRGKSRDFWTLVKARVLPSETADYIPKFLAAMTIGENPREYGFDEPKAEKYPNLEAVEIPSPVRLHDLAKVFNVPVEELQRINPNLTRDITPPYAKNYEIWVPEDRAKNNEAVLAQLAQLRISKTPKYAVRVVSEEPRHYHVVKSGETLRLIAQKYKVSPRYLKRINGLASTRLYAGTRLRITAKSYHPQTVTRYAVRRGDNLNLIAKKFGLTVKKLKSINSIRGNALAVGQVLKIRTEGT